MKTFVIKLTSFFLIMFLICVVINQELKKYNNTPLHYGKQFQAVFDNKLNSNCIIIGSSHATHSIIPSLINQGKYKYYNLSLNGAGPIFYLEWYKNIYSQYCNPSEYCIIGVDWFMFNEKYAGRLYEQSSMYFPGDLYKKNLRQFNEYNTKILIENRYPFFIHKTFDDLIFMLKKHSGDDRYVISKYDDGYVPYEIPYARNNFIPPPDVNLDSTVKNKFETLIQMMQSKGTKIIFVSCPEYHSDSSEFEKKPAIIQLEKLSVKYGIPFLNYNTELRSSMNDSIENFSDWGHMNFEGSKKFSQVLSKDLAKLMK